MKYTAKVNYQKKDLVSNYDRVRFHSLHGRLVDLLEKKRMLEGVVQLLQAGQKCVILDIPGGTGRLTDELLRNDYKVIEADISMLMLAKSRETYGYEPDGTFLGYVCCDLEYLPFADKSIDVTASLRVMGHLPLDTKEKTFCEFSRVSRLGMAIMMSMQNPFLKIKRFVFQLMGVRPKPEMWFPVNHRDVLSLSKKARTKIINTHALIYGLSESRRYTFRIK